MLVLYCILVLQTIPYTNKMVLRAGHNFYFTLLVVFSFLAPSLFVFFFSYDGFLARHNSSQNPSVFLATFLCIYFYYGWEILRWIFSCSVRFLSLGITTLVSFLIIFYRCTFSLVFNYYNRYFTEMISFWLQMRFS